MNAHDLLVKIQACMDGVEWTPGTLDEIAELLNDNGYPVREPDDADDDEEDDHAQDCADGMHSWVNDPSVRDGNCKWCGEPYKD